MIRVAVARVEQAFGLGAVAVGATVYFGSQESRRQLQEISQAFEKAHELGLATILWCYLRNPAFKTPGKDFHAAADLTAQANYLGVTIEADIVKQKQPTLNGGHTVLNFGHTNPRVYSELAGQPPHRHDPLPGGELLHGPGGAHQFRRLVGGQRPGRGGAHRDNQ